MGGIEVCGWVAEEGVCDVPVLQCVAVCCSVVHCVAVCCRVVQCEVKECSWVAEEGVCDVPVCSVLQCVEVSCSVVQFGASFAVFCSVWLSGYRVATISRLHKIIGLFCRIQSLL